MDYFSESGIYNCRNCQEPTPFLDGLCCYCEYPVKAKIAQIIGVWLLSYTPMVTRTGDPTDADLDEIEEEDLDDDFDISDL